MNESALRSPGASAASRSQNSTPPAAPMVWSEAVLDDQNHRGKENVGDPVWRQRRSCTNAAMSGCRTE